MSARFCIYTDLGDLKSSLPAGGLQTHGSLRRAIDTGRWVQVLRLVFGAWATGAPAATIAYQRAIVQVGGRCSFGRGVGFLKAIRGTECSVCCINPTRSELRAFELCSDKGNATAGCSKAARVAPFSPMVGGNGCRLLVRCGTVSRCLAGHGLGELRFWGCLQRHAGATITRFHTCTRCLTGSNWQAHPLWTCCPGFGNRWGACRGRVPLALRSCSRLWHKLEAAHLLGNFWGSEGIVPTALLQLERPMGSWRVEAGPNVVSRL